MKFSWDAYRQTSSSSGRIGKVANAVLTGFKDSNFYDLTMFSEVLQDSTFDLIDLVN
jgi:acyl-CoA hydrolase